MKKLLIFVLAGSLAIFCAAGCGKKGAVDKKQETITVKVMTVKKQDLGKVLEYIGNIKGRDEAVVYPKVSGKIIEKAKEENGPVNKGEVILYIDRDEIGLKFEKAPVESPLTGVVGRIYVDIGASVTPQTPVALVSDMSTVQIDLDIPEKYLPRMALGQEAIIAVDAYPGREFRGKVTEISPLIEHDTRTAPIEITIDDEEHLLISGMFAKIKLMLEEHKDVPVILKEALIGKQPDLYVFVIEDSKARLRNVSLGIREGAYIEVTKGVKEGDRVVIMGQQRLRDGSPVIVEE